MSIDYIAGLFVPLMNNDAAHHANIALHMYLSGDYVNLVDAGKDYLDKPHLFFWLCAWSYRIFGVTTFAYKFPSFCFTIAGTYSTFRLGKILYGPETGKLAAILVSSAFAYMLANSDVRMDAMLTCFVAFATWQGVEFIQTKKILNAVGLAVALALGFSTKGHIAIVIPGIGLFCYILYRKDLKLFLNPKWLIALISFFVFIFPVVYCYYLQYDLHPEKSVRGIDHINGVNFILFNQSIERFRGDFGSSGKNDYFFFFHSFLWAFAPWSLLAYAAIAQRSWNLFKRKTEWLSVATFIFAAALLTFSVFKLPHYINIIFPATAVVTASWVLENSKKQNTIYFIQLISCALIVMLLSLINLWMFPVRSLFVASASILFLLPVFYFFKTKQYGRLQKAIAIPVCTMILCFFLLNVNFYPQLLTYQAGNQLAKEIKGQVDPANIYYWKNNYNPSFNFYTATERKQFDDSVFMKAKQPTWLFFKEDQLEQIMQSGYKIGPSYNSRDFGVSRLSLKFVNPITRKEELNEMVIGEISGRQ